MPSELKNLKIQNELIMSVAQVEMTVYYTSNLKNVLTRKILRFHLYRYTFSIPFSPLFWHFWAIYQTFFRNKYSNSFRFVRHFIISGSFVNKSFVYKIRAGKKVLPGHEIMKIYIRWLLYQSFELFREL